MTALMGMTMVVGISTEMAIFYVSEYTELASTMTPRQALREATRNRLRPITMTTLAALLTLAPLALAIGQGSAISYPAAARDSYHFRPASSVSAGPSPDAGSNIPHVTEPSAGALVTHGWWESPCNALDRGRQASSMRQPLQKRRKADAYPTG